MGTEIERKFLARKTDWEALGESTLLRQGYFLTGSDVVVRIRLGGGKAFLTVKGPESGGKRLEFEYSIPPADAEEMLIRLCRKPVIEKTRYRIPYKGRTWEVDVFHSDNEGLVLAEVELDSPHDKVELPPWVEAEVTGDPRYSNAKLAEEPYGTWHNRLGE